MVFRSNGVKSHLYLRGEIEIKEKRRDSKNSEIDKLIKKIDKELEEEKNELV